MQQQAKRKHTASKKQVKSKQHFLDNERLQYLLRAHVRVLFEVSVAQGGALVTAQGLGGQQAKKQTKSNPKSKQRKTIKKQSKSKQKAKSFKVTAQGLGGQQAKNKQKASKEVRKHTSKELAKA